MDETPDGWCQRVIEREALQWTKHLMFGVNVSLKDELYSGRNT